MYLNLFTILLTLKRLSTVNANFVTKDLDLDPLPKKFWVRIQLKDVDSCGSRSATLIFLTDDKRFLLKSSSPLLCWVLCYKGNWCSECSYARRNERAAPCSMHSLVPTSCTQAIPYLVLAELNFVQADLT
jgi:hypothetical protein